MQLGFVERRSGVLGLNFFTAPIRFWSLEAWEVYVCRCSKKLLDQDEVSKVAPADSERGFTPEDVKLMKIQFSSCRFRI